MVFITVCSVYGERKVVNMLLKISILVFSFFVIGRNGDGDVKQLDWWQTSIIYQIYPRSFKDSDDDGVGDLKGIEEQAEYFKNTGIGAVWLSPIYKSPMADMGYDISDFKDVDSIFGKMEDFVSLQQKLESLGVKLVLDFVPNHTSDEHEWFEKSVKRIAPYTDFYVWKDPVKGANSTETKPPNNWVSVFGGSAWTYNNERKQYYLHQFAEKQPDLNYRSEPLKEEMKNILRFWLDKKVDGFRVDSVPYLVEDDKFLDEPKMPNQTNVGIDHDTLEHKYTMNQKESLEVVREFRKVLDEYKAKDGKTRLLMTEGYVKTENVIEFYGNATDPIAHFPFNFLLLTKLNGNSDAKAFNATITEWHSQMTADRWGNWVLENHDNRRVPSRFDPESVDALNMLLLLLPGTAIVYNGEELGMEDTKVRLEQITDIEAKNLRDNELKLKKTRDPERTPFQWNNTMHAGFSKKSGSTWLPVNPNYYHLNVEAQKEDPRSHYNTFKKLIKLRENDVIRRGQTNTFVVSSWVFGLKRSLEGEEMYILLLNLNNEEELVTMNDVFNGLPEKMNVFLSSSNSEYNAGDQLSTNQVSFIMRPKSAIILQAIVRKEVPSAPLLGSAAGSLQSMAYFSLTLLVMIVYLLNQR